MTKRGPYRSKQRTEIIDYLSSWQAEFLSVEEMAARLEKAGVKVGLTTIYRTLRRLEDQADVVKIPAENGKAARYRYIRDSSEHSPYGRLQCTTCGRIQKLDCQHLNELIDHIEHDHNFHVSRLQTLFYGDCESCSKTKLRGKHE